MKGGDDADDAAAASAAAVDDDSCGLAVLIESPMSFSVKKTILNYAFQNSEVL